MKKILITMMLITGIFAQNRFTLVGGLNIGSIRYNDSDFNEQIKKDKSMTNIIGLNIGAETSIGPLKMGASFIQRGAKLDLESGNSRIQGTNIYNYISGYGLFRIFPVITKKSISIFGGLQLGKSIGGKENATITIAGESESFSENIEADAFQLDYGVIFGIDYMLIPQIGVRASYYMGLANVIDDYPGINHKNNGIGITLLYTIRDSNSNKEWTE